MNKLLNYLTIATIIMSLASCMQTSKDVVGYVPAFDTANMDLTVKPGDDFYQYANGIWIKNHPIPEEFSRYGAFEMLYEENNEKLKTLVDELIADRNAKKGSVKQKISLFFAEGMDTTKIEKLGIKPLEKYYPPY